MPTPAMPPLNNPCLDAASKFAAQPWCDPTLPIDERVADMVSRMNITEKIANMDTEAPAIESLGLNAYNWWSEATHGVSHVNNSGSTPGSTNFAFPITTSASFNRSLWRATGAAISREARAFMNAGHAYSTYWAPVVNLAREPRWGRNLESAGECPYVSGEYATAFVDGFERLEEEPRYLAASACCKHYAANSMEVRMSHTAICVLFGVEGLPLSLFLCRHHHIVTAGLARRGRAPHALLGRPEHHAAGPRRLVHS